MKTTILLALSVILIGCSTNFHKDEWYNTYDTTSSKAMNVVLTGGITTRSKNNLQDMPYLDYEKALLKAGLSKEVEAAGDIGMSVAKLTGNMLATPGISDAFGGGIMLLQFLTKSDYDPVRYNGSVIWMPKTLAKNKKEAQKYIEKLLVDAFLNSLGSEYSYELTESILVPTFGKPSHYKHYVIKGERCNDSIDEECRLEVLSKLPDTEKPAPQWMMNEPTYHWSMAKNMPAVGIHVKVITKDQLGFYGGHIDRRFLTDGMLLKMSATLPEWFYFYSPYSRDRNYPVVFNQGEKLYFIQPNLKNTKTRTRFSG